MKDKHFLSISDLTGPEIKDLFTAAKFMKKQLKKIGFNKPVLNKKTLVMMFEKPSLRTRLSFEAGMTQLGGHAVYLGMAEIGMGVREKIADVARVTSGMGDLIVARTFKHQSIEELAEFSKVPVVNGLSDLEHPCQALADFMTILEVKGILAGLTICFIGDGENNIAHSLCLGSAILGIDFKCASPQGYFLKSEILEKAREIAGETKTLIQQTVDPEKAIYKADVVYTDTWISMGDEKDKDTRLKTFLPYQVTGKLMELADSQAIFMHDLPAYRGQEVTREVIDGPQSVVFKQAHNRLHVQKALLIKLVKKN